MKKIISLALTLMFLIVLASCGSVAAETVPSSAETTPPSAGASVSSGETETQPASDSSDASNTSDASAPESVTVTTYDGNREQRDIEVPYNPQKLAVMDLAVLDMLDNFGLGDRVVGVSKGSSIDYLQDYVTDDGTVNLGTIKEADLEAVMSCEPDLIFIGGRLSAQYDTLSEIAPVIFLATDTEIGLVESVRQNANIIARIFGVEDMVTEKMAGFDARIQTLADYAEGKTAVVGLCTAGSFNILGNDGRCSIIGVEIGFDNIAAVDVTSTHGNESSFEILVDLNPQYIFIMDRDAAINAEGAQLAAEIMDNELVAKTDAYQNGGIVILDSPAVWYTAEGGITALDVMLSDLENALLK
ncbi:MAG: ABC transporter substrate-binding protein [Synergistaceae bacterium]|jgi:iron complex transport system substrate-binding protein|nr:ABC transporter substrate-binding protein [Synergistaceae bacterium]